jgi:DNA modification methylase
MIQDVLENRQTWHVEVGDALAVLRGMPDESVHMVCTSPPYWGLRDYGEEGQIGLEPTPEEYVDNLVDVFRGVRRALRADGTVWLNLGDSYAANRTYQVPSTKGGPKHSRAQGCDGRAAAVPEHLKPKDLVGIPWRVAFALQADGWVLRSEIIWSKPNPMPESVTDRPTKAHEQVFLFSKAEWLGPEPWRFASMSDTDAAWVALFIETEGNICVKRVRRDGQGDFYGAQIAVANCHLGLLERLAGIVGAGNINERAGKNAPVYYWQVSNKVARDLLHRVYPFMIAKRRQARICIHLESLLYHRGKRHAENKRRTDAETNALLSLWARNKACNQFAAPDLSDVPEPSYGRWTKSQQYYFDADAVREDGAGRIDRGAGSRRRLGEQGWKGEDQPDANGRNIRTVWTIPTHPYPDAHFATFPPKLVIPCIKAGCPEGGVVLDPFSGAGTTGLVARRLGRRYIGIELNPEYATMSRKRILGDAPLFNR